MKSIKRKSSKKYCEECGKELSHYEIENFGELCSECYNFLME